MAEEMKQIKVLPGSEVDRLLSEAARAPVLLERDGELYRLHRHGATDAPWAGYNAESVREAVRRTTGAWGDLDVDLLIAELYRAREEGSRPADRP